MRNVIKSCKIAVEQTYNATLLKETKSTLFHRQEHF